MTKRIKLTNGRILDNVVASGALAFDGLGWPWERPLVDLGLIQPELFTVFLKSLTAKPRAGNLRWWKPWECVRLLPNGGAVNKIGLTNQGIDWWCDAVAPTIDFKKYAIAISLYGDENELTYMARKVDKYDVACIEVNDSCPNTGHVLSKVDGAVRCVEAVKRNSRHPVIYKASVDQDYLATAERLSGLIEAISLNSVSWKTVFPNDEQTPLWRLEQRVGGGGGGVSGGPAQKHNWVAVEAIAKQEIVPVIAPSIMEYEDLAKVDSLGAGARSYGAIHLRTPWKPTAFVLRERREHAEAEKKAS